MIPILSQDRVSRPNQTGVAVGLVTTRIATGLTGLSTGQLREWSSRRALIPADVQNRGRGTSAQYSWQTILLLRVALLLKERFHLELHAHRGLFAVMREALGKTSFLQLWGKSIAIYDSKSWELLDAGATGTASADAVILNLDPHLFVLAAEFAMPSPAPTGQLELFPARLATANRPFPAGGHGENVPELHARRLA